jgi:hypothetical protein
MRSRAASWVAASTQRTSSNGCIEARNRRTAPPEVDVKAVLDGIQEVEAQPGTLLLIPRCGQFRIAFGRTPEYDLHFSS